MKLIETDRLDSCCMNEAAEPHLRHVRTSNEDAVGHAEYSGVHGSQVVDQIRARMLRVYIFVFADAIPQISRD